MSNTPDKNKADSKPVSPAVSRRGFITNAAAATAGVTAVAGAKRAHAGVYKSILPSTVLGANERIYTGHIGVGGMGRANLGFVLQRDDMQPIALCDLYPKNVLRASQMLSGKFKDFSKHHDFREVIENKDVDAVVIATSDHWHCLCTLHAADAGKDIYCEKPLSTTIVEGQAMIDAVRRNDVVFQGGTMQRSGEHFQEAVELIKSGYIGKIARVETYIHDDLTLEGIGQGDNDISNYPGCDWNFHQGWVEHQPFNTNRWIYNFRWFLDYSGGKITDWGAHLIDIVLWAMGEDKQPKSVCAQGAKFLMEDNRTTPDTLDVLWEYDDYILSFGNRVWSPYVPAGYATHGILFHGTRGTMLVSRGGYEVFPSDKKDACEAKKRGGSRLNEPHWQNFADCVRSRQRPICDVEVLNNTTLACHIGTCAYAAGGKVNWDSEKKKFFGSDSKAVKAANKWAYRKYENGWSLKPPYWRGKGCPSGPDYHYEEPEAKA